MMTLIYISVAVVVLGNIVLSGVHEYRKRRALKERLRRVIHG
jgi:hypothetical protein